jgi:type VI secretion system secreted protein VgrG
LPQDLLPPPGPFEGRFELNKTDGRHFQNYRYRIVEGDKVLLEGRSTQAGMTNLVTTERSRLVEVHKTIMRDDQRITENWAGYISGTLAAAKAPPRDVIPSEYVDEAGADAGVAAD